MKRTTEFIIGLIGGILGTFFGLIGELFSLVWQFDQFGNIDSLIGLYIGIIFISILGIVGAIVVKFKPKIGGVIMIIAAIGFGEVISRSRLQVPAVYILLPLGILLIIAGIMGLFRRDKISSVKA